MGKIDPLMLSSSFPRIRVKSVRFDLLHLAWYMLSLYAGFIIDYDNALIRQLSTCQAGTGGEVRFLLLGSLVAIVLKAEK